VIATAFVSGGFPLLGVVFLIAALFKARASHSLELTLVRTTPRWTWASALFSSRRLARSVIGLEFLTGLALLSTPPAARWWVAGWASILGMVFCLVAVRAVRRRTPCGCFGASKAAGKTEVIRAGTVLAISVTLLAFTAAGVAGAPLTRIGTAGLTAALLLTLLLMLPSVGARLIGKTASAATPDQTVTSRQPSRRAVLRGLLALASAAVGLAAIDRSAALAGTYYRTCKEQYDLCYGCGGPLENECCVECYVLCVDGGSCVPHVSCGGCWPDPYINYP
jgi:hypothetical protein